MLEIGPGLGTLTNVLCEQAKSVIAVEFDRHLAQDLTKKQISNLTVLNEDFLQFDPKPVADGLQSRGQHPLLHYR